MDYATMLATVVAVTGSFEYEFQGTGYLFTFVDKASRDAVAVAIIRGGASVERRGEIELFIQL